MSRKSLVEALSSQWHAWERRGRGWSVYPHAVALEPPFRPLLLHYPTLVRGDDGAHDTALSRLAAAASGQPPKRPTVHSVSVEEPHPESYDGDPDAAELQIRLPENTEVTPELSRHLLLTLAAIQAPVSFELIGIGPTVVLQVAVPRSEATAVQASLEAFVPEVRVSDEATLVRAWDANVGDSTVIVEFGLRSEFMLPLATPGTFRVDPLQSFLAAIGDLGDHEIGLLQVLFEQARKPWADEALRALSTPEDEPFFADAPHLQKLATEKLRSPLFGCCVRVAARVEAEERAWQIARRLGGGLSQFSRSGSNEFMPLERGQYDELDLEQDLMFRRTQRSGMLLSLEEMVGLVHVPAAAVRVDDLRTPAAVTKRAPETLATGDVYLGENRHRGRAAPVFLPLSARLRHTHVVGATGTGKSTLLLHLIQQDMQAGRGVGLLDPHGDLADAVLGLVPTERQQDIVLFDPSDEEFPVGFNVLAARSDRERTLLSSDLTAIFRRFSTSWGDQMTAVMSSAVVALLDCGSARTLIDLRRFLTDREFRAEVLADVTDPLLLSFWHEEFPRLPGARSQLPITNRLDAFLRPRAIRNVVAQPKSRLDLRRVMDSRCIFVAKLSQGAVGEENAHLLGSLLVTKLHQAALSRDELPEHLRSPFLVYIDEFHHFLTASLGALLTDARKYGVGLVLAHQELRQLVDQEVRGAVLANPAVRVCFRLGSEDARQLSSSFASFQPEHLVNLATGEALCRVGQSSHEFNVAVPQPLRFSRDEARQRRDRARDHARQHFATPRAEVEALIARSWRRCPEDPPAAASAPPPPPVIPPAPAAGPVLARSPVPPAVRPEPELATPGRGGAQHKYLQGLVKQAGESKGYRATLEAAIGSGRADVLLERDAERIAVEVSVTTSVSHEIENLRKCLAGGATRVLVLAVDQAALAAIRLTAAKELVADQYAIVSFCTPEDVTAQLPDPPADEGTTVLGYRVRRTVRSTDAGTAQAKQSEIARTVTNALRRLKRK